MRPDNIEKFRNERLPLFLCAFYDVSNITPPFFLIICLLLLINTTFAQTKPGRSSSNQETQGATKNLKPGEIPTKLREALKITEAEKLEYKEILSHPGVKIVKIWHSPCRFEPVINAQDAFCFEQTNFRPASYYSFPGFNTRAGIALVKGEFESISSKTAQALLVDIGEVDLRRIGKRTKEVLILGDYPQIDYLGSQTKRMLLDGFEFQGLKIGSNQPSRLNHTYLLKTATHNSRKFLSTEGAETIHNQKIETIHAFRVVNEKEGIATVLWKKIKEKIVKADLQSPA